jgi:hypothetical protein
MTRFSEQNANASAGFSGHNILFVTITFASQATLNQAALTSIHCAAYPMQQ